MKNIKLDLLFILLLVAVAAWMQFHISDLPMLGALVLVPLLGNVIATPKKSIARPARVCVDTYTGVKL